MGCIAEYPSAVPQSVETHLLSNQAVINFRGLRNIEAAFFIPAWFVLPSSDGFTHGPWPMGPRFWGPRATLSYDDSVLTKNLRNCAEA